VISVILYGRNDAYGYNLHKRAAISLNCIAEVLDDPEDEILFVDYNTPDNFPTFPEAIQDTLTARARKIMRIFRARPHIHERYRIRTHLVVLEPISRNIAVRRSNPANRWILSTNTDIVVVPQAAGSLTSIARSLEAGFWQAPRVEIPETLWEGLDRREPRQNIDSIKTWGRSLHLDEIVITDARILYDGCGDFQLMERTVLFDLDGFDEDMLLGWHVDSNIAVRMGMHYGRISDFGSEVYAYHCDHTRLATPAHGLTGKQNSIERFVDGVTAPYIPAQRHSWGCAHDELEEVRVDRDPSARYISALSAAIGSPLESPSRSIYAAWSYDKVDYDARHILPFLVDIFSSAPRTIRVAWWGARADTLARFARVWAELGFINPVIVDGTVPNGAGFRNASQLEAAGDYIFEHCEAYIFDFGDCSTPMATLGLAKAMVRALASEYARMKDPSQKRRTFIGINVINNRFETFFCSKIGASATPFSTRLRHGFAIAPPEGPVDWLPSLQIGRGGERIRDSIESRTDVVDWMFYGPYRFLPAGRYRVGLTFDRDVTLGAHEDINVRAHESAAILDVHSSGDIVGLCVLRIEDLINGRYELTFDVPFALEERLDYAVEVRMRPVSALPIRITSLLVESVPGASVKTQASLHEEIRDWLPFANLGAAGHWRHDGVGGEIGRNGHMVYGPYWRLPAGDYEARLDISVARWEADVPGPSLIFEAMSEGRHFGFAATKFDAPGEHSCVIRFSIEESEASALRLELPVWTSGLADVCLRRLVVSGPLSTRGSLHAEVTMDCLPLLKSGPSGRWWDGAIVISAGDFGFFAEGSVHLGSRRYYVDMEVATASEDPSDKPVVAMVVTREGGDIVHKVSTATDPQHRVGADFELTDRVEVRFALWTTGLCDGRLRRFEITRRRGASEPVASETLEMAEPGGPALPIVSAKISGEFDWLPQLRIGPGGHRTGDFIESRQGVCDCVFYGPYKRLRCGHYVAKIAFGASCSWVRPSHEPAALLEAVHDLEPIARKFLFAEDLERRHEISFCLKPGASEKLISGPVEVRLRSLSGLSFRLEALSVRSAEADFKVES
jgi:hypothetical protein